MTLTSRLRRIVSPSLLAVAGLSTGNALDLATFEIFAQGSGIGNATYAQIIIVDHLDGPGGEPSYRLFESLEFTPNNVGESFIVDSSDPQFELFKQTITNGTNDRFGWGVNFKPGGGGVGFEGDESFLFSAGTHYPGPGYFTSGGTLSGPDYAGYEISKIELTVDSFEFASDGLSYSHDLRATVKIVSVPEPSGAAMLLLGVVAIGARRRSR